MASNGPTLPSSAGAVAHEPFAGLSCQWHDACSTHATVRSGLCTTRSVLCIMRRFAAKRKQRGAAPHVPVLHLAMCATLVARTGAPPRSSSNAARRSPIRQDHETTTAAAVVWLLRFFIILFYYSFLFFTFFSKNKKINNEDRENSMSARRHHIHVRRGTTTCASSSPPWCSSVRASPEDIQLYVSVHRRLEANLSGLSSSTATQSLGYQSSIKWPHLRLQFDAGSSHHRWKKVTKGPPSVRNVRERMKGRQRATPDRAAILFLLRIPSTTYTVVLQLWIARTREGHISHQNWCSPAFDVFQQD